MEWQTLGHVLKYRQMDTIEQVNSIVVNSIEWGNIGIMVGVLMLGGVIYNLWHARSYLPLIGALNFNLKKIAIENSVRFVYCLLVSFVFSFTFNWIPESSSFINTTIDANFAMSAVGLLAMGFGLAKVVFSNTIKKEVKNE